MKVICLFAIHRTGTNYLGSVLRQWPELAAFGELFHPLQVYGLRPAHLRALSNVAGREFAGSDDPALVPWLRAHPLEVVDALRRVARRKDKAALYFKVFLGQWTRPTGEVIAGLARVEGFTPVLLQRRCLDAYVSYRKAESVGAYKHADTTDSPEQLDATGYAHWADIARRWYADVDASLSQAGRPPIRATYERDVNMPAAALAAHWARLLDLPAPPTLDASLVLARQDRSPDLPSKIANYPEFCAGLKRVGLWDESQAYFLA
jgi:hypothetical protein